MEAANTFLTRTMGWMPARVALALMAWSGFINLLMVRVNLSVIIVAMVGRSTSVVTQSYCYNQTTAAEGTGKDGVAPADISLTSSMAPSYQLGVAPGDQQWEEFDWNETIQGFVLGSFSYGYALTQVVGGRLAEVYGVKWVFGGCIMMGGICNILSPAAARLHYGALITLRVVQGLCQGVAWPSMNACTAQWIPPLERPRFIAIVYYAATLGLAITLPLCGFIIDALGWAAAFYVCGSLSLVWCLIWFLVMHSTPAQHPRISHEELQYIESTIRTSGTSRKSPPRVPWRRIATSLPVWALLICDIGSSWGITLFSTQLPTFMKNVLGFSIKANGILSALPFLCRYVGALTMSFLASWISRRGHLSIINNRRLCSIIAMMVPAVLTVGLVYAGCNWQGTITIICLILFFNGAVSSAHIINHIDIAPNFSGTLMGITNTFFSIMGFVVPVVTGVLTDNQQTLGQWRKVFWVCAPMYALTEIFYLVFLSGSVQSWNYADQEPPNVSTTAAANAPDKKADEE